MSYQKPVTKGMSNQQRMEREGSAMTRDCLEKHKQRKALKGAEEDPVETLRTVLIGRGAAGIKGIGRVFKIMDDDRYDAKKEAENYTLTLEEFEKGMHTYLGNDLSEDAIRKLFQKFDKDGSGEISYNEFLEEVRGPISQPRKDLINLAFKKLDKTGNGVVDVEDLKGTYSVQKHPKYLSGEWSEKQCLEQFLIKFEADDQQDGKVTKEEFFNYYVGVSNSIDNDPYFDLMMRNAWKL